MTSHRVINNTMKYLKLYFSQHSATARTLHTILLLWTISIPVKNSVYQLTTIALCLAGLLLFYHQKSITGNFIKKYKFILLLFSLIPLTMAAANVANGVYSPESWVDIFKYTYRYILIFFALLYFLEAGLLSRIALATMCILSLSIYCLDGVIDLLYMYYSSDSGAIQGLMFNRNIFGLIMHSGIVITVLSFIESRSKSEKNHAAHTVSFTLLLAFFSICLIFSYSRAAWVATAIFIMIICCTNTDIIRTYKKQLIILFLTLILLMFFNDGLYSRFLDLIHLDDSLRFEAWLGAVAAIKHKPFLGYGLIEFKSIVTAHIASVHNSTLEILFATGLTGLLVYLGLLYVTAREIILHKKYPFLAAVASYTVISQFDHSIFHSKIFLSQLCIFLFFIFSYRKGDTAPASSSSVTI